MVLHNFNKTVSKTPSNEATTVTQTIKNFQVGQ